MKIEGYVDRVNVKYDLGWEDLMKKICEKMKKINEKKKSKNE